MEVQNMTSTFFHLEDRIEGERKAEEFVLNAKIQGVKAPALEDPPLHPLNFIQIWIGLSVRQDYGHDPAEHP